MPKYSAIQTELIETMAQTLPLFAPARSHRGEDGYGYFVKTRNYMLSLGETYNGAPIDLTKAEPPQEPNPAPWGPGTASILALARKDF